SNQAAAIDPATRKSADFKNQLFAISGVSGGSVAAVMFEAALADAKSPVARLDPPCQFPQIARDDKLWFGNFVEQSATLPITESWKSFMQLLTAGDFLSPAFVRLVGADVLNLRFWYGDRAQALEQSWERRYKLLTGMPTLDDSFTDVRQKALDRGDWLP